MMSAKSAYIVTGTSRGIGKALAKEVVNRSHLLFSVSRSSGTEVEEERHFRCDLSDAAQVDQTAEALSREIPLHSIQRLVLVNNAGVLNPIAPLERMNQQQIATLMQVNFVAPVFLMAAFMRISGSFEGKSGIINISSGAAHHPYAGWSLYCASKAALEMVTACASMEQRSGGHPLYMAAVAPGVVETGMQEEIRNSRNSDFPMRSKFIAMQKSGDLADPAMVARQLLDLDSTGQFDAGGIYDLRDVVLKDGCPTIVAKSVIK